MWATRNKWGFIELWEEEPFNDSSDWLGKGFLTMLVNDNLPELTFENSPQEVELKIKEK